VRVNDVNHFIYINAKDSCFLFYRSAERHPVNDPPVCPVRAIIERTMAQRVSVPVVVGSVAVSRTNGMRGPLARLETNGRRRR